MLNYRVQVKRLLISTIAVSIIFLSALSAENREPVVNSIAIIFDSSFSMHIEPKLQKAVDSVKKIISSEKLKNTEWALISFGSEDDSKIELVTPFTPERKKILKDILNLKPWGVSPIDKALNFTTSYIRHNAQGKRQFIVLVSDCISTDISGGDFLDYVSLIKREKTQNRNGIKIFTLAILPRENPPLALTIKKRIPHLFTPGDIETLIDRIAQPAEKLSAGKTNSKGQSTEAETPIKNTTIENTLSRKQNTHSIILTVILIPFILLFAFFTYYLFSTKKYLKEKKPTGKTPSVEIEIVTTSGKREKVTLTQFPVTIGTTGDETIFLPKAGNLARQRTCTLHFEDKTLIFNSNKPIVLNGVERKEKKIKVGDFFILGRYRVFFRGISEQITYKVIKKKSPLPYLILAIGSCLLVLQIIVIFPKGKELSRSTPKKPTIKPEKKTLAQVHPISPISEKPLKIRKKRVIVYSPGAKIHFFKADILFIHAHPDDESLDFGCLMAKASRDKKKIVTVLFTDGEAGIDQYPNRIVNNEYPTHDLHGRNLARVRIEEATKAMAVLGSDVYIRLGLKNHPYNSVTEQLPRERVLRDWGGEKRVVAKLVKIIEGFKPELIVSADKHTCAYEHFEHEAVGYLVRKAIKQVEKNYSFIKGFIVSVDPLQKKCYPERITVNGMKGVGDSAIPRIIQQVALSKHITQRDASVIGREILPNFRYEYYHPIIWKMGVTLEKYLSK